MLTDIDHTDALQITHCRRRGDDGHSNSERDLSTHGAHAAATTAAANVVLMSHADRPACVRGISAEQLEADILADPCSGGGGHGEESDDESACTAASAHLLLEVASKVGSPPLLYSGFAEWSSKTLSMRDLRPSSD